MFLKYETKNISHLILVKKRHENRVIKLYWPDIICVVAMNFIASCNALLTDKLHA